VEEAVLDVHVKVTPEQVPQGQEPGQVQVQVQQHDRSLHVPAEFRGRPCLYGKLLKYQLLPA
jgi:hypothetical protein